TIVLSSDMGGVAAQREAIQRIGAGEADIIVGTQIIAKGQNEYAFSTADWTNGVYLLQVLENGKLMGVERVLIVE
ncbi:MAG: hypothetical protein ACPGVB_07935, partial [Chitinophagales bacterium]